MSASFYEKSLKIKEKYYEYKPVLETMNLKFELASIFSKTNNF